MSWTVTVNTNEIVERVQKNRDAHRKVYEKALERFRTEAIKVFNAKLDELKAGGMPALYVRLPVPEDHTKEYDVLLDMLHSHRSATVELDWASFRRYVRDEWDWKDAFVGTTMNYMSAAEYDELVEE